MTGHTKLSPEREAEFRRLHGTGRSDGEIGDVFGVAALWVLQHRRKLRLPANAPHARAVEELVQRQCNMCGKEFEAEGRFIRTCSSCKNTNLWRGAV